MTKEAVKVKTKEIELTVYKVENDSVIVMVNGWRMRVYKETNSKVEYNKSQLITVSYTGDLEKPNTLKFGKIK